jgi:hypothetical protein
MGLAFNIPRLASMYKYRVFAHCIRSCSHIRTRAGYYIEAHTDVQMRVPVQVQVLRVAGIPPKVPFFAEPCPAVKLCVLALPLPQIAYVLHTTSQVVLVVLLVL